MMMNYDDHCLRVLYGESYRSFTMFYPDKMGMKHIVTSCNQKNLLDEAGNSCLPWSSSPETASWCMVH